MGRKHRIDYPGAWHHVMHRGARRAPIFQADAHCGLFLRLVEQNVLKLEMEVHGYALMPNHYHLLLRSRQGNLSDFMRNLNSSYTRAVNEFHGWDGPVFRGRFHSQLVDDERRLPYLLAYIHLNPLRANLATRIDADCWTSHRSYLGRRFAPFWVETSYFLDVFGSARELQRFMLELHRGKTSWPEELDLSRGLLVRQEQATRRVTSEKGGGKKIEPRQVLELVCELTNASLGELKQARRGPRANPARRFAVWALRENTLLTSAQIGQLLGMTHGQVSNVIHRFDPTVLPFRTWLDEFGRSNKK